MDMSEIIVVVLLLLVGAGLVYYLLQHRTEPQWSIPGGRRPEVAGDFGRQSDIQRDFARVFSMTSPQGKENIIRRWMDRSGCDRTEAMRLAVEELRRDNR